MFDRLYKYYFRLNENDFYSIKYRALSRIINIYIEFCFHLITTFRIKLGSKEEINGVVISMTSFPQRIPKVHLTITSILLGVKAPIILVLCKEEFSNTPSILLRKLNKLEKLERIKIEWVEYNYKPHNKYLFAAENYRDFKVITVDDDIIYPPNMVSYLLNESELNPRNVIANISRKMSLHGTKWESYIKWPIVKEYSLDNNTLPLGVGGVLYPVNSLPTRTDLENFKLKNFVLKVDDLWLKYWILKNDQKVITLGKNYPREFVSVLYRDHSNIQRLRDDNVLNHGNDAVISRLFADIVTTCDT